MALMSMGKKKFRTKSAIAAFEQCLQASSLPDSKRSEVVEAINGAKQLLQAQDDAVSVNISDHVDVKPNFILCILYFLDSNARHEQLCTFLNRMRFMLILLLKLGRC